MSFKELYLEAAASALPEYATEHMAEGFLRLTSYLSEVGSHMNLTAITEESAVVWLHLIDSLHVARVLSETELSGQRLADVGSGGGFPALPVALAMGELSVTAIDSTEKKCRYIADCAARMGLSNVGVLTCRAEEYGAAGKEGRESFSAVTARAVARLSVLAELCLPLVEVGGVFVAMKGEAADAEAREAEAAVRLLGAREEKRVSYTLGDYADGRTVIVYRKVSPTPEKYPRGYGKISKSPLR